MAQYILLREMVFTLLTCKTGKLVDEAYDFVKFSCKWWRDTVGTKT